MWVLVVDAKCICRINQSKKHSAEGRQTSQVLRSEYSNSSQYVESAEVTYALFLFFLLVFFLVLLLVAIAEQGTTTCSHTLSNRTFFEINIHIGYAAMHI